MSTELCELAFKYGSDKCPRIRHYYTPYYYQLFADRRETVRKVVEIGVGCKEIMGHSKNYQRGASLFMWRDFFPNAQIYGADILPELAFKDERIEAFTCDQTVRKDLENLIEKTGPDIDLFVDDGSHVPQDQVFTCLTVMPMLQEGVVYAIEDILDPDIANYFREYDCQVVRINRKKRRADKIIVIRNKVIHD
jgi:hypothetical protein